MSTPMPTVQYAIISRNFFHKHGFITKSFNSEPLINDRLTLFSCFIVR